MSKKKIALIDLLHFRFPALSKKELFARILCGEVIVNGEKIVDKKRLVKMDSHVEFTKNEYVSRGGLKLAPILHEWNIKVKDKIFIDAGASTGGFTDCLLQHSAETVYAVDVGYNQLAYSLRTHSRVRVYERTNIMDIEIGSLHPPPHAAVCDLSFRSIHGAASHILDLVTSDILIALIKPQFEWEHPDPGFDGVIHNVNIIPEICRHLIEKLYAHKVYVSRAALSPVPGTKGNTELFFLLKKSSGLTKENIMKIIEALFP